MNDTLDPRAFTIKTAVTRMETLKSDPVRPVIEEKVDLAEVMQRLGALMSE